MTDQEDKDLNIAEGVETMIAEMQAGKEKLKELYRIAVANLPNILQYRDQCLFSTTLKPLGSTYMVLSPCHGCWRSPRLNNAFEVEACIT